MKNLNSIPQDIINQYGIVIHDNKVKVCKGPYVGHIQYNCNGIEITETDDKEVISIQNHSTGQYIDIWRNIDYVTINNRITKVKTELN